MTIRIYNTLSGRKEPFRPITPGKVGMYVCGPTVYDSCHIGHARSVVVFDVIFRYFKAMGYEVTYVRNFTDVDDKIIRRANELNIDSRQVAEKYIDEFHRDMDGLNIERATFEPKVTDHIDHIIAFIERLIQKGMAYESHGDVYYAVRSFDEYGKLSGRRLEDMAAGARVAVDERKNDPFDFALWKAGKPGEPAWPSPWGEGRPGWHIECSAMGYRYLGESFDIHGGGKDLIFPHHENEIAQSEGAFSKTFANYWIHNGFVNINQEKMSKSLGNFLVIRGVLDRYHPEAVRLFLLSNHYRSPIDFADEYLKDAVSGLNKIYALLRRIEEKYGKIPTTEKKLGNSDYWKRFCEAMDDDFNTAAGIGILFEAVRDNNRLLDGNNPTADPQMETRVLGLGAEMLRMGRILGILLMPPEVYFESKRTQSLQRRPMNPEQIEKMIAERKAARKEKDWAKADRIRTELEKMDVVLEDRADETIWKVKE